MQEFLIHWPDRERLFTLVEKIRRNALDRSVIRESCDAMEKILMELKPE